MVGDIGHVQVDKISLIRHHVSTSIMGKSAYPCAVLFYVLCSISSLSGYLISPHTANSNRNSSDNLCCTFSVTCICILRQGDQNMTKYFRYRLTKAHCNCLPLVIKDDIISLFKYHNTSTACGWQCHCRGHLREGGGGMESHID